MGSFVIMVINLYRYKDGDVINLRKSEYVYDYFRYLHNAWKYDLTINLRFFRPVLKVKNINNYKDIFDFRHIGLVLVCDIIRGLRDCTIYIFWEKKISLSTPRKFFPNLFFVGIIFHTKTNSTLAICYCSWKSPPPRSTMISPAVIIAQKMMEKKRIKTKIWVGCCKG